jgi:cytochrome P450
MNLVVINNPHLIKRVYSDPRTLDAPTSSVTSDLMLTEVNGELWRKRRRILFANLMSVLNSVFVENATKNFMFNHVFKSFDEKIALNEKIVNARELFRPLGFSIVLHGCFGKELESLDDPFWIEMDAKLTKFMQDSAIWVIILILFGSGFTGNKVQQLLGIPNRDETIADLTNMMQNYALSDENMINSNSNTETDTDTNNNAKKIKQKKMFVNFVEQYSKDVDDDDDDDDNKSADDVDVDGDDNKDKDTQKLTVRHLYGDMMIMFLAATDSTYSAIIFCLLMAAKYPAIQEEIHRELMIVFDGDGDGDGNGNNLDHITLQNQTQLQ